MSHNTIDELVDKLRQGELSRRGFVRRATALGISATAAGVLARGVAAQESTPAASPGASPAASPAASPVALTGSVTRSITREEFDAAVAEEFQFEEPAQTGGDILHVQTTDIQSLNTTLSEDVYSGWITGFIFDALLGANPIDGTPVPGLADYWESSEDGLVYNFYLNKNAKFHDGTPVTAADVEFTFQSVLAEDSLSVRRGTVAPALKQLIVVDDHTVQFIANEPSATFVNDVAGQFGILPKHIWESVPFAEFGADPGNTGQDPSRVIGSGPFKFVEWVQNDHVTLEKNADYWDAANVPVIDRYIYRVVADAATAVQSLVTGENDLASIPFTQAETLRASNPELNIVDYDTTDFNYFYTQQDPARSPFFTEVPVRQALLYALDRALVAEQVYQGFAIQADGTQPVLSVAYRPDQVNTIYNYDPDQASSLLESAGWVDSDGDGIREKDGVKFSFECLYSEGVATYEQQIPYMQQAWDAIGVEMIPTAVPFPTLSDNADSGNFHMVVQGFSWGVDGSQEPMFGCEFVPPAGFNRMGYCNPEYDELAEEARLELDPEARINLLVEASNIANDEAAIGIMVFRKDIEGASPRVHNFLPNGYSTVWWIQKAWVEQES